LDRLEVVLLEVVGDLVAKHRSLRVGDAIAFQSVTASARAI
jgi:hypothetical protein